MGILKIIQLNVLLNWWYKFLSPINQLYKLPFPLMHDIRNLHNPRSVSLPAQIPILASQTRTSTLSPFHLITIQLGTKHGDITTQLCLGLLLDRGKRKARRRRRDGLDGNSGCEHGQGWIPEFYPAPHHDGSESLEMLDWHEVLQKQHDASINIDRLGNALLV